MRQRPAAIALAAAIACGLGTFAHAQDAGPDGRPDPAERQASLEAHQQRRLQDLRTVLHIRPAQEAALATFADVSRPPEDFDKEIAASMTTSQRLDEMARMEAAHAAAAQRRADALRALYAALDPDQRQVFDALARLRGPHGPGGGPTFCWRIGPGEGPPH